MGGLLALNSGCADIERDTVQLLRMSSLEVNRRGSVWPLNIRIMAVKHITRHYYLSRRRGSKESGNQHVLHPSHSGVMYQGYVL